MSDAIVYGLRTCNADMTSRGGFAWPREGWVEAPDWDPSPECGGGLHFLRNGEGDADLLSHDADAVWQVIMSYESETVDIDNTKSKAKRCNVLLSGPWHEATAKLRSLVGSDKRIPYVCETAGDRSVQTAGYYSVQTAGDRSVQTAGGGSVLICRWCDVTTGHFRISVAIVGNGGTLKPNTPYRVSKGVWTEVTPETGDAS